MATIYKKAVDNLRVLNAKPMTTKNIQDVVVELDIAHREYEETANYAKWQEDATAILTQLVKEVEEGERKRCIEAVSNSRTLGENLGVSVECKNARWQAIWDIKKPTTPPTSDVIEK